MNEEFLYYLWQYGLFDKTRLRTTDGQEVEILHPGYRQHGSGPDFTDARIRIGDKLWAGNVELHVRSSDWYAHHHETDPAYDSVILHVVYEHDMPVYNTRHAEIPTLALAPRISTAMLDSYRALMAQQHPLACHGRLGDMDPLTHTAWTDRLYIERLEDKTGYFMQLLDQSLQDWEGVLYLMLLRYFGMSQNTGVFEQIGRRLPYAIFRKYRDDLLRLEALLLGTARLLPPEPADAYTARLIDEYRFLARKHQLQPVEQAPVFGRMRPSNFPTIRLAQLAKLYHMHPNLFAQLMHSQTHEHWPQVLRTDTSDYWIDHIRPGKPSRKRRKFTGRSFIHRLIINAVLPLKFAYEKHYGRPDTETFLEIAKQLPPENNRITRLFVAEGLPHQNALESQAYIQLFRRYCTPRHCARCAWGHRILKNSEKND